MAESPGSLKGDRPELGSVMSSIQTDLNIAFALCLYLMSDGRSYQRWQPENCKY